MLSIGKVAGGGALGSYYTDSQTAYYANGQSHSYWGGGAKTALKLPDGPVERPDLARMLSGQLPDGTQLGRMVGGELQRDHGRDLTFALPKSASLLAFGPDGDKIIKIHDDAVRQTMSFVEREIAQSRTYNPQTKTQEVIGQQKIVWAAFREPTSRAGDPHIHSHVVLPNIALGTDGKFRSLHNQSLYEHRTLIGAYYRSFVARGLREQGYELRNAGKYGLFEIRSVPRQVTAEFSKRRNAMLGALNRKPATPQNMARIVLSSRPRKISATLDHLKTGWEKRLGALGSSFKRLTQKSFRARRPQNKASDAHTTLTHALHHLSENNRAFTKHDILRAGLTLDVPKVTGPGLEAAIKARVKSGELLQSKDGMYLQTKAIYNEERDIQAQLQRGKSNAPSLGLPPAQTVKAPNLTSGQSEAVQHILKSRDRIIGIQGTAGTGKTTLMKAALPAYKKAGYKLIGIAPTSSATQELTATGLFDKTQTSQSYDRVPHGGSKTVLVIDEASMLGNRDMRSILRFANDKRFAKVILMGDTAQHAAVGRGTPFADLQEAGLATARLDQVVRQKAVRHKEGVEALALAEVAKGLIAFKHDVVEANQSSLIQKTVNHWTELGDDKAPIIVQTNRQKDEINALIKETKYDTIYKPHAELKLKVWRPVHLTQAEKQKSVNYREVDYIRFNRSYKRFGIEKRTVWKVITRDEARHTLTLQNGRKRREFMPAEIQMGKDAIETYRQTDMTLNAEDRIRFTRSEQGGRIDNNALGEITTIRDGKIHFKMDNGKTFVLSENDRMLRHIDHGWASTSYAFQGKTVDKAVVLMPAHNSELTKLSSLYVSLSRHRHEVRLITNDAQRLSQRIQDKLQIKAPKFESYKTVKQKRKSATNEIGRASHNRSFIQNWLKENGHTDAPARGRDLDRQRSSSRDEGR